MYLPKKKFFVIFLLVFTICVYARPNDNLLPKMIPERGFVSTTPANNWEQSLITGNGKMGAMVYGKPLEETIILNRAGLFMPLHEPLLPVNTADHLAKIRELISNGHYQMAADFVVELAKKEGWGEKRWTDPFIPAFDLLVIMPARGTIENYHRAVNFETGEVSVEWKDLGGQFCRRLFVSRTDNIVVLSIISKDKVKINCSIRFAQRPTEGQGGWWPEEMFKNGIRDVSISAGNEWLTYRSSFKRRWPGSLQGYEGAGRIIVKHGVTKVENNSIQISNADEVLVFVRIEPTKNFSKSMIPDIKRALKKIPADYDLLLGRHYRIHGEIFNRVRFDIGGGGDRKLTAEELYSRSNVGHLSKALLEKEFDACRYSILCSSGDYPPTLQGIWGGTWSPPWSSDYTQNGNLQCAMASMLSGNMAECLFSFFNYMDSQMNDYRLNAKWLYGCRGIDIASRTSSHGLNNHFDRTWPMTFWTAGAGWNASFFYDYYLYTGDKDFLFNKVLPFMKEAVAFYEDFLIEDKDGKYIFNPSYSPENNPGNSESQACANATMDIAVVKELLTNLIAVCQEFNIEKESRKRWKQMLAKMPAYMINEDGALKEWTTPLLKDNYAHRHCSHLYPLFNGLPEEIADNHELQQAFKKAIELRMQKRREENGGVMAFGLVQLGLATASLRDAEMSYEIIDWLANRFWCPTSLTTTHDPQTTFNVDLCGGLPAIIIRMLVSSRPGCIELLPALPEAWPSGKIEGIPCRGQVLVKSLEWNPQGLVVVLESKIKQQIDLKIGVKASLVSIKEGRAMIREAKPAEGRYLLLLPARSPVKLEIGG
ncbi:MAG TPA: glycoside hydrolase N-terminal domain-containing protein [Candidatus Saccharicenans sp.]|jgi:hypothetical protein|nr:glycoside hydrolase N-terminal domain-containing protein [Candidatus Saccharicenans sp.]HQK28373.1 glycoside hydrolase N-terminal domain-containing protein [Smithellaceae bacterium]